MIFTAIQKVIKVGSSSGNLLPAKELKRLNIHDGDQIEITVKKVEPALNDTEVIAVASSILERYHEDFKNLAQR